MVFTKTDNEVNANDMEYDEKYMRRAIQLARSSRCDTHPNPNVGAVIVARGRIIGEGYHRCCGQGHAEVNAVASVAAADRHLLKEATMYVTLEPCSHYGKTPPCAQLIIDSGIPRVVVGAGDPFERVAGRGIRMLRDAGVEVTDGVLADEARALNPMFGTAHTYRRPYVTLKWAQSADRFMAAKNSAVPVKFSTPLDAMLVHRQRALHDAVLTTADTVIADNPRLDVRLWHGRNPDVAIVDRRGRIDAALAGKLNLFGCGEARRVIVFTPTDMDLLGVEVVHADASTSVADIMAALYSKGITSVMTECGPRMLQAIADAGMYDTVRVFTACSALGDSGASPAPRL